MYAAASGLLGFELRRGVQVRNCTRLGIRNHGYTPSSSVEEMEKTEGWAGVSRSMMGGRGCPISRALCGAKARVNTDASGRFS